MTTDVFVRTNNDNGDWIVKVDDSTLHNFGHNRTHKTHLTSTTHARHVGWKIIDG